MSTPAPFPTADLGTVLVIGGNGFLGHHIVRQALETWRCARVVSLDLRCAHNRHPAAEYHECDITDAGGLAAVVAAVRPAVVVHTASPLADAGVSRALLHRVNVEGTRAVVAACRAAGVPALVYTSSASVVSDFATDLRNADERWPVLRGARQPEYYSETKAAAEALVLDANRTRAADDDDETKSGGGGSRALLLTASIRPAGIFGEGDGQAIAGFIDAHRRGRSGVQLGDNNNIFDYTYVGNVAHAHLLAARHLLLAAAAAAGPTTKTQPDDDGGGGSSEGRVDGEAFFVTNDSPVYFWDFARAVWRAAGSERGADDCVRREVPRGLALVLGSASEAAYRLLSLVCGRRIRPMFTRQRAMLSTMTRYFNIGKARTVLGYEPLWTMQEGVDRGVGWFLANEKAAGGGEGDGR